MLIINLTVIEIVINTMLPYPWKKLKKHMLLCDRNTLYAGWQLKAEVNIVNLH